MDIIIGPSSSVGLSGKGEVEQSGGAVEAKVLSIRPARQRRGNPPAGEDERRSRYHQADPANGRVIVLLVPEGYKLPRDIESGNYRTFLRFVPRRA